MTFASEPMLLLTELPLLSVLPHAHNCCCSWTSSISLFTHCSLHRQWVGGEGSRLQFCFSVYNGVLLTHPASPELLAAKGTLNFVGRNLKVDNYMLTDSRAD